MRASLPPLIRRILTRLLLGASLALLPGCKGCRRGALSSAHPVSLPDGTVVLVKDATGYGAFVLRNQWPANGETVDYEWFFRTNGTGRFSPGEDGLQQGVVTNAQGIRFGPFNVSWSGSTRGLGWLYYPLDQHGGGRAAWQMCVTTETNASVIRPDDPKWKYRGRPPFSWEREQRWLKSLLE